MKAGALPLRASTWFGLLLLLFVSQHIRLLGELIGLTLLVLPGFCVYMLRAKAARLDRRSVSLFLVCAVVAVTSYGLNRSNEAISPASFLYLLFLTTPFTLRLTVPPMARARCTVAFWNAYRAMMILTSILGIAQVALGESIFSFRDLLPIDWRLEGFNTTNAITYGGSLYRANGFVFLEPSFFSQFLGLAILVEMRRKRDFKVISLFLVAMISSFSGTGIALLAFGLVIQALGVGTASWRRAAVTLLPLLIILVTGVFVFPDFFLARLEEFVQENSSAYIRFVSPALYIFDAYTASPLALVFGVGPGVASSVRLADVMADFPGIGKVLYEYGLSGGIALVLLYTRFCALSGMVSWIRWPFLLMQFVLNNGIFSPITLSMLLLLAVAGNVKASAAPQGRTSTRSRRLTLTRSARGLGVQAPGGPSGSPS